MPAGVEDPGPADASSPRKHKQTQGKRSKYASVACNACKKRKLKCVTEGRARCQRCEASGWACVYAQSHHMPDATHEDVTHEGRFQDIDEKIAALQSQLDVVQRELVTWQGSRIEPNAHPPAEVLDHDHVPDRTLRPDGRRPPGRQPDFIGPTRPDVGLDVSEYLPGDESSSGCEHDVSGSSAMPNNRHLNHLSDAPTLTDPLCLFKKAEILELIDVFDEDVQTVYPFVDIQGLVDLVNNQFEIWCRKKLTPGHHHEPEVHKMEFAVLKMVVAIGKILKLLGKSYGSRLLVESVEKEIFGISISSDVVYEELVCSTLMSIYHSYTDEELLAWRNIGFAGRMVLECSLHRRQNLVKAFPHVEKRSMVIRLFWCIYMLDRQYSFGTGLPFVMQDEDIDPELPGPDQQVLGHQYLVQYARICSEMWRCFPNSGTVGRPIPQDTIAFLEFRLQNWTASIPPQLRQDHSDSSALDDSVQDRSCLLLRTLLRVRFNHAIVLLNRHHVLSAANVRADRQAAQRVVDAAKDTIQALGLLHNHSDIYVRLQASFNHFLLGALTAIFLAVRHGPTIFEVQCRDSFHQAVDLVREVSMRSLISRRLWKSVRGLLNVGRTLGLHDTQLGREKLPAYSSSTNGRANRDYRSQEVENVTNSEDKPPSHATAGATYASQEQQQGPGSLRQFSHPIHQDETNSVSYDAVNFDPEEMNQMTRDLESFYEGFGSVNWNASVDATGFDFAVDEMQHFLSHPALEESNGMAGLFQDLMTG